MSQFIRWFIPFLMAGLSLLLPACGDKTSSPTAPSAPITVVVTATFTPSLTPGGYPGSTWTYTPTSTGSPTSTGTAGNTSTLTLSPTVTNTATFTPSFTVTDTPTITFSATRTETIVPTETPVIIYVGVTDTWTATGSPTPTFSITPTPTPQATGTMTNSPTVTDTATLTSSFTATGTPSVTFTATGTETTVPTETPVIIYVGVTDTWTNTDSPTPTFSMTQTATPPATGTITQSPTVTDTATFTSSFTPSGSPTVTFTATGTETTIPTETPVIIYVGVTDTWTSTVTYTSTSTPTITKTPTGTWTPTITNTPTNTATPTYTSACSPLNFTQYSSGTMTYGSFNGVMVSSRYTLPYAGSFSQIKVFLATDVTPAGNISAAIYTDNGTQTAPLNLIVSSGYQPAAKGWNTFWVTPTAVEPVGTYWIVLQMDSSNTLAYVVGSDNSGYSVSNWAYGAFPTAFPSGTADTRQYIFEAAYCYGTGENTPTTTATPTMTSTFNFSPTPLCSSNYHLGYDSYSYTQPLDISHALLYAEPCTVTASCYVATLHFYVSNILNPATFRGAVYTDAGGPSALVFQTGAMSVTNGWNAIPVNSSTLFTPGIYWLAFWASDPNIFEGLGSGSVSLYAAEQGNSTLPSTFPTTSLAQGNSRFAYYADYCLASGVPTYTSTPTLTFTPTPTSTPTITSTGTITLSPSVTLTRTFTLSPTPTVTGTPTITFTQTLSPTVTISRTPTVTLTPTGTPFCYTPLTFGAVDYYGNQTTLYATYVLVNQWELPSNGTVTKLNFYVVSGAGNYVLPGIYQDDGTQLAPGSLLYQGGAVAVTTGWNTVSVPNLALSAGYYWLALGSYNLTSVVLGTSSLNGSSSVGYESNPYTSLPASPSWALPQSSILSYYATYCP